MDNAVFSPELDATMMVQFFNIASFFLHFIKLN